MKRIFTLALLVLMTICLSQQVYAWGVTAKYSNEKTYNTNSNNDNGVNDSTIIDKTYNNQDYNSHNTTNNNQDINSHNSLDYNLTDNSSKVSDSYNTVGSYNGDRRVFNVDGDIRNSIVGDLTQNTTGTAFGGASTVSGSGNTVGGATSVNNTFGDIHISAPSSDTK